MMAKSTVTMSSCRPNPECSRRRNTSDGDVKMSMKSSQSDVRGAAVEFAGTVTGGLRWMVAATMIHADT
jgi:hypothetical protein